MLSLVIDVQFLDERFHGRRDDGVPEWPPSPMRLFQALLASAKSAWSDELTAAFKWLESQPPPVIRSPATTLGSPRLTYVPNNNSDTVRDPAQLRTGKTIQPTLILGDPRVTYQWPLVQADRLHAERVAAVAPKIRALGWGIDLAIGCGRVAEECRAPETGSRVTYYPHGGRVGGVRLRRPVQGTLASLEAAHAAALQRIDSDNVLRDDPGGAVFEPVTYSTTTRSRPWVAFSLEHRDAQGQWRPNARVRQSQIKALVAMMRHAIGNDTAIRTELGSPFIEDVVLGHGENKSGPRVSISPLPSIGHPHSDGQIRRVLLSTAHSDLAVSIDRLGALLHSRELEPEVAGSITPLRLVRLDAADAVVQFYTRTGTIWTSATPVLLPGFDKRRGDAARRDRELERAERLVARALGHSHVEETCRIELSRVPWIAGSAHALAYEPRTKLRCYPRYHVRLRFDTPVTGPMSIGAGRHMGFGIMANI